jgi:origin recognition complex subunit 1
VIDAMQNSPTAVYLVHCSEHERIMLAATLKCIRKNGTETVKWGEVSEFKNGNVVSSNACKLARQHMIYSKLLPNEGDSTRMPTNSDLKIVLMSLISSRALLTEDGATAAKRSEDERKVMLLLEPNEVERVLGEVGGERWKSTLGAGMS